MDCSRSLLPMLSKSSAGRLRPWKKVLPAPEKRRPPFENRRTLLVLIDVRKCARLCFRVSYVPWSSLANSAVVATTLFVNGIMHSSSSIHRRARPGTGRLQHGILGTLSSARAFPTLIQSISQQRQERSCYRTHVFPVSTISNLGGSILPPVVV